MGNETKFPEEKSRNDKNGAASRHLCSSLLKLFLPAALAWYYWRFRPSPSFFGSLVSSFFDESVIIVYLSLCA